jgi:hypothetical protein
MHDFIIIKKWSCHEISGTKKRVPVSNNGLNFEISMKGMNNNALVPVLKSRTGNTALFLRDFFLKIS